MEKKDLTGQRFGKLTVLREADEPYRSPKGKRERRWVCRCDCGTEVVVLQNSLTSKRGDTRSCGCLHHTAQINRRRNIIGERFGKLVVIGEYTLDKPEHSGNMRGLICKCDCGVEIKTTLKHLLSGKKSCGCLLYETKNGKYAGLVSGTNLSLIDLDRPANKSNKLGIRGVYWCESEKKYRAKIGFKNKTIDLGRFDTLDEAVKARKEAEKLYFETELEKHKIKNEADRDSD